MHLAQLDQFEQLTKETSSEKRRQQLRNITDLFFASNASSSGETLGVFDNVMGMLARDLEIAARQELARRLAAANKAPPEVIYHLANDDIAVARPVLEEYRGFSDNELSRIATNQGQDHLHAISGRSNLSEKVTDVLVRRGNEDVLGRVVTNQSAKFSKKGFETLSLRSGHDASLQAKLTARKDIPEEIFKDISAQIAARLKRELAGQTVDVSDGDIFQALSVANERVQNGGFDGETSENARRYVSDLKRNGRLNEIALADLARNGRVYEAVHGLARLAGIDSDTAYHILLKAEAPALVVTCRSKEFDVETFAALLDLKIREQRLPDTMLPLFTERYRSLPAATAQRIMRFLNVRLKTA